MISDYHLFWINYILIVVTGFSFIYIKFANLYKFSIIQGFCYFIFFTALICLFSSLIARTKRMYDYEEQKSNLVGIIGSTLEKYGLVKSYIIVSELKELRGKELDDYQIYSGKKINLETTIGEKKNIEIITSSDGKEILKVLKNEKIT